MKSENENEENENEVCEICNDRFNQAKVKESYDNTQNRESI